MALADGRFGSVNDFRENWVGIQGDDLVATVELDSPRTVASLGLRCLQDQRNWIFLPAGIVFEVSRDGVNYEAAAQIESGTESAARAPHPAVLTLGSRVAKSGVTHIRIRAKSAGGIPAWHPSAGERAWVFADEIILE